MFPCFSINNAVHMGSVNSIGSANFSLSNALVSKMSYFKNLTVGKFTGRTVHAPIVPVGSMSGSVKHIFAMSIPGKVFKKAVGRNSIEMSAFHPRRAWANKGLKNKPIDQTIEVLAIYSQSYGRAVPCNAWAKNPLGGIRQDYSDTNDSPVFGTSFNAPTPVRPYAPLVRNFITREVRNWLENLRGSVKVIISHGASLLNRVDSGSEPERRVMRCPARFL